MTKPCGAKTRTGGACKNQSMENGRCRKHGGLSTGPKNAKGNQNAFKHGIYAAGLRNDEHDLWDQLELGSIDQELKLCRIRLRRALMVQQKVDADPNNPKHLEGFEVSEITRTSGTVTGKDGKSARKPGLEIVSKRPDFNAIIDRLIGRIESLERTRLELLKDADDAPEAITIRIKRASKDGA